MGNSNTNTNKKYIFYWQSNFDPYDHNHILIWEEYDQTNQDHLNLKYEQFCNNSNNFCFSLLHPLNNYDIDFGKMQQIHRIETYKIRPIKKEDYNKQSSVSQMKSEEDFLFFWKENENPWDIKDKPKGAPYDLEDQFIIEQAFEEFLVDKSKKIIDLKKPVEHFIDFSKMLQISKITKIIRDLFKDAIQVL